MVTDAMVSEAAKQIQPVAGRHDGNCPTFYARPLAECTCGIKSQTYYLARSVLAAVLTNQAISGADIKPGMTILLTPGSKPFRVDGVEPFNKSESTFVLTSGAPHSESSKVVSGDRWYCLLGGGS